MNQKTIVATIASQIELSLKNIKEENTNFGHWFWTYLLSKFSQFYFSNAELRELLT
jgi:hypothetical protein